MASIIRNGVRYGGGGGGNTNSIDISWEDYQALGDEKFTNNITYYISDGQSSGGGNAGGTGEVYMRYVNDPNDENFDWVQVQDAEGNWKNSHRAYTTRYWFMEQGLNRGNLHIESYDKTQPTIAYDSNATTITLISNATNNYQTVTLAFDEIDISNYDKIVLHHNSKTNNPNPAWSTITLGVKDSTGTKFEEDLFFADQASKEGTVELDVSNMQGKVIVYFTMKGWYGSGDDDYLTITINNMYLE